MAQIEKAMKIGKKRRDSLGQLTGLPRRVRKSVGCGFLGALAVTIFAAPVMAEGWSVYDLGGTNTKKECLSRAKTAISSYIFNYGGGHTAAAIWTVYGYDLTPGDQDAVILCDGDSGTSASLVVHGETTEDERIFTADQIEIYWNR